jgi:hypothetical protein
MPDHDNPFADLDLQQAIELRWTLRDIKAKRWILTPIDPRHLAMLIERGLVEMGEDFPALTGAGLELMP